jgi:transcriptional regulator with XRE-family HTH domain
MGSKYFDLKRFREDKNISQVELSKATGISQSLISKIENRKMPLTDENAGIIDNIYGNITCYYIDDESFYQDSDNPKPNFDGIGIPYFNVDFITGYDVI